MNNVEYAGFWIRVVASLIDSIIFIVVVAIVWFPLSYIFPDFSVEESLALSFLERALWYLPVAVTIWLWIRFSATPGKMITGLMLVDAGSGKKITVIQGIIRYLGYIISSLPLFLGLIWVGIDKKKQGWHDKLAGTVVLKKNRK